MKKPLVSMVRTVSAKRRWQCSPAALKSGAAAAEEVNPANTGCSFQEVGRKGEGETGRLRGR